MSLTLQFKCQKDSEFQTKMFSTVEECHAFLIEEYKRNNIYLMRCYITGQEDTKNQYGVYGVMNGDRSGFECYLTQKKFDVPHPDYFFKLKGW